MNLEPIAQIGPKLDQNQAILFTRTSEFLSLNVCRGQ